MSVSRQHLESSVEQLISLTTSGTVVDLEQPRYAGMPMFPATGSPTRPVALVLSANA
jgi:hypothetical protein